MPSPTPFAALVPDTALLVPGASGRADVLADVRAAARAAVGALLDAGPARVVVVAPAGPERLAPVGPPDLGATGLHLPGATHVAEASAPVAVSVARHLLDAAGWSGPTAAVGATGDAAALADLGRALAAAPGTAVLLLGSLSARHGPDAPLAEDARAVVLDDAVLGDLVAVDDAAARARLAAVDAGLARDLAVTAWGPWQVLVGLVAAVTSVAGGAVRGDLRHVSAPFGVPYAVLTWGRG